MCQGGGVKQLGVFRELHVAPRGWRTESEARRGRASPGSAELGAGAGHPGLWSSDIPLRTAGHYRRGYSRGGTDQDFMFRAVGGGVQREMQAGKPVRGQGKPWGRATGPVPSLQAQEGWEVGGEVLPRWSWEEWLGEAGGGGYEDSALSCALQ